VSANKAKEDAVSGRKGGEGWNLIRES
jgi:hypothetical protein